MELIALAIAILGPCVAIFGLITVFIYLVYKGNNKAWQEFANKNHLSFTPGNYLAGNYAQVTGNYGDHLITLNTSSSIFRRYISTRMCVEVNNSTNNHNVSKMSELPNIENSIEGISSFLIPDDALQKFRGHLSVFKNGQKFVFTKKGVENNVKHLQFILDQVCNLTEIYPVVVALGGEVTLTLQTIAKSNKNRVLKSLAHELLNDIGRETEERLKHQSSHLICPRCMVHCGVHKLSLSWSSSITYYGCRACGQSREFINSDKFCVVAILDSESTTEQTQLNSKLQVNWLVRRKLFDFDEVEIIQATDEDVERFTVQVGNDTDPIRCPDYYKQMRCTISSNCNLSENTIRILGRIFGQIEVKEVEV